MYGFIVTNQYGYFVEAFLSQRFNAQSQAMKLNYYSYSPSSPIVRLLNIMDGDGRTNTTRYAINNVYSTNLISQVTDPFGRSTTLQYDGNGQLTNITDMAGNSTAISYDTNNWVNTMTTPYGTTSFTITASGPNMAPNGRSVLITKPDGSHEYYLYQDNAAGFAGAQPSNQVPTGIP